MYLEVTKIRVFTLGIGAICLPALMVLMTGIASAQIVRQDRVETNLVLVDVLVMDRSGRAIRDLSPEQFELVSDGKQQKIEVLSTGTAPVTFGIIYDMHPTTADRTKAVIESLQGFKKRFGPQDDIFLVAFDGRGQQAFDFIPAFEQLERHMTDPQQQHIQALYDAVYFAYEKIQTSRNRKRVLLILSDGADHQSRHTYKDLRKQLSSIRTEVYAVIVDETNDLGYKDLTHDGQQRYPAARETSLLERAAVIDLAQKSGGGTYFGSNTSARLQRIFDEIAGEMRSHYTLGFYPEQIDDRLHTIKVRLRDDAATREYVLAYKTSYSTKKR